jgi:hypothetical protein
MGHLTLSILSGWCFSHISGQQHLLWLLMSSDGREDDLSVDQDDNGSENDHGKLPVPDRQEGQACKQ